MMKKYLLLALAAINLISCSKDEVPTPDFNVTTDKTTYKVGEAIQFKFTGNADLITFYSGMPGKEYQFKDRFKVDGKPQLTFTSYRQVSAEANTISLLASTNFKGIFNPENVAAARWTDITGRATFSTGTDNTASGVVDLTDFLKGDSSVYIAFRFTGKKDALVAQPTWTIKNLSIDNKIADGSLVSVATSASVTWGAVDFMNTARAWSFSATQIQIVGGPVNTDDNDDWLITKPLSLDRVQRSTGVNVRTSPLSKEFGYAFTTGYTAAGTYTATFEAINNNRWDSKTVVKQIVIKVEN